MRVLSSLKTNPRGRQPRRQPRLDLFGLFPRVAQGQQVVGVPDQHRGARPRRPGVAAGGDVADSGGLFHPVQGHVHQHGTDHPALRAALLGRGEPTLVDHPGASARPRSFPARGTSRAGREDGHDRSGRTRRPGRRLAPTWRLQVAPRAVTKIACIASWQLRPGRNPYDRDSNRASHSGSNALTVSGLQRPVGNHRNPESAPFSVAPSG